MASVGCQSAPPPAPLERPDFSADLNIGMLSTGRVNPAARGLAPKPAEQISLGFESSYKSRPLNRAGRAPGQPPFHHQAGGGIKVRKPDRRSPQLLAHLPGHETKKFLPALLTRQNQTLGRGQINLTHLRHHLVVHIPALQGLAGESWPLNSASWAREPYSGSAS